MNYLRLLGLSMFISFSIIFFVPSALSEGSMNIIFDEPEYNQGDLVSVTLFADNEQYGKIYEFYVSVEYEGPGLDYVEGLDGTYFSAVGNSASFDFRAARANTMVTVESWAFDEFHNDGGIPVAHEESQVYVSDALIDNSDDGEGLDQSSESVDSPGFELFCFVFSIIVILFFVKKIKDF